MNKLKSIGFPISYKENEHRRALVPDDIAIIKHKDYVYVEKGYGDVLGIPDSDYVDSGVHVVTRDEILSKEIICDPKIGDAEYLEELNRQTIFGWIHAVQNRDITDKMIDHYLSGYAWEDMFDDGRHVFWKNNEIAGEAAIFHAFMCHGVFPYGRKVAVLGRGNAARGAIKMLNHLGAEVVVYDRRTEHLFKRELNQYDVVVNAILWDTSRTDHIICDSDLECMKKGSMIIDISCDRHGGVESSIPTTIVEPTYIYKGVRHYVVDHTPALFWKTTSQSLSREVVKYIDFLIEDNQCSSPVLSKCHIMEEGEILDDRIKAFQHRS